jgi:hypothetical protein
MNPDALEAVRSHPNGHLEDRHSAGSKQSRSPDLGDNTRHFARLQFMNGARIEAIFVSKGKVVQQIFGGLDPFGFDALRKTRTYAFDVLDRCIKN